MFRNLSQVIKLKNSFYIFSGISVNHGSEHFTFCCIDHLKYFWFPTLTLDCRFECDKNGTIGGFCDKEDGFCQCKDGFHGDMCDKSKI